MAGASPASAQSALPRPPTRAVLATMTLSGCSALVYQLVWTQQATGWLGQESAAVLAVLGAFFGGLAAGAFALRGVIARSARPARVYAACEAVIGVWCVVLAAAMTPASRALLTLTGEQPTAVRQWSVAFVGMFLLLLPATAAMGATLPAMSRAMEDVARRGVSIAALYAGNTLGAVLGVAGTVFWAVPTLGLEGTARVAAALNLACAALAWRLPAPVPDHAVGGASIARARQAGGRARVLALLASTGLLGIGYEVLAVHVLAQVAESTVFTFGLLLSAYLVGTALGAAALARWRRPERVGAGDAGVLAGLLVALAAACLAGGIAMWSAERIVGVARDALGGGLWAALTAEAAVALAAMLPPTLLMGAVFSESCVRARAVGLTLGAALGANTLGAALAAPLVGVALLPAFGAKGVLLVLAAAYLVSALVANAVTAAEVDRSTDAPGTRAAGASGWTHPPRRAAARRLAAATAAVAAAGGAMAAFAPPLVFVDVPSGGEVIAVREGAMAVVSVVADADGVRRLRINNRAQEGSSATGFADARQALLPLLLHPSPRKALFIGLGTGMTAAAATGDPLLDVTVAELLPEVVEASAAFTPVFAAASGWAVGPVGSGEPGGPPSRARLHVVTADGRRFARVAGPSFDVIVADNVHPARSGSAALYTIEHFAAMRARLAPGGVLCQWLPLHQMDLATLRSIVQAFRAVFPEAAAMLATHSLDTPVIGLVARNGPMHVDPTAVQGRLVALTGRDPDPADVGLEDAEAVLGAFIAGPPGLARFAGGAVANTDDRPVVAYMAPRTTYAASERPRDRLLSLLDMLHEDGLRFGDVLVPTVDREAAQRLAAYWSARDRFLAAGRDVRPSTDPRRMLAQVLEPLLDVLRACPDFRPAYEPLLRMATGVAAQDPATARYVLEQLVRVQPARPEAATLLARLRRADRRNGG